MSMSLSIRPVKDSVIEEVKLNSVKLYLLLYGEIDDDMIEEAQETYEDAYDIELTKAEKKLFGRWTPKMPLESYTIESYKDIHYLLNGQIDWRLDNFPMNFLLAPRMEMGDIGWGKANFYTSDDVKEINKSISEMTNEDLLRKDRLDSLKAKTLNTSGYSDVDLEDITNDFKQLQNTISDLVRRDLGMYIAII